MSLLDGRTRAGYVLDHGREERTIPRSKQLESYQTVVHYKEFLRR